MGQQQSSKAHAPLTFGYINNNHPHEGQGEEEEEEETYFSRDHRTGSPSSSPDFVLDNPHLYQLESTCHHCSSKIQYPVVVAEQANSPCTHCRQNKRLSLVRRDLANDLHYIDETYYPNIVHYEEEDEEEHALDTSTSALMYSSAAATASNANVVDHAVTTEDDTMSNQDEDDTHTLRDEEGWSRLTFGEITPSKRLVSSPLLAVDLSGKSLIKLSSSIGYLDNLTKLDLSDNQMINLPRAIGRLKNLRIFNASKNQLETIPDTITSLSKLKAINFSHNRLTLLPKGIGSLPSLIIVILNHNQLTHLPRELANLNDLITLNISHNPLKTIPAEISALKSLRKLTAEACAFEQEMVHTLAHDPPSLFELCARRMVKSNIPLPVSLSHHHIADYFKQKQACSFCFGPYFESCVTRSRFIERTGRQVIALDYKLCCAHWTDENDRISAMFSTPYYKQQQQPPTATSHTTIAQLPPTPPAVIETAGLSTPSSPVSEEDLVQQDYFNHHLRQHRFDNSSEDILCVPTAVENEASTSSSPSFSAAATASPITQQILPSLPLPQTTSTSYSSFITKPNIALRPRSSSTSLLRISAMQNHHHQHQQHILSTPPQQHQEQQQQQQHEPLPFATLTGRQSEEADRILSRQQQQQQLTTRKTNGLKQGFAQLGARLSRKNGGTNNNQTSGSSGSSTPAGNRDRSETV
ncbi:membrane protein [Mucor ambiguus]|uniref:Membrane protein n=1 Tax=Mucor ambiguus TaxID=91626 RepID=A0A0C9M5I7_9FUNG|nr:membrane protein [Mucor ambiguus]